MTLSKGHSLVDLMFCLLIGSTIASMAAPSLGSLIDNSKATQLTNQLVGLLHYARSEAVFAKRSTAICAGHTHCNHSATWHTQLLVFHDNNHNGQIDAEEEVLRQDTFPPDYSWHWSRTSPFLIYERDGTTRALNGTFTLCRQGVPLQQVIISLSGRVRTQPPSPAGKCG